MPQNRTFFLAMVMVAGVSAFAQMGLAETVDITQQKLTPTTLPSTAASKSDAAATTVPADLARRLDAIDARASAWQDLTADFVQRKYSPLLKKPLVSRGTIRAKGGDSLWHTTEPEPSEMGVNEHGIRLYYADRKVIEEYPIQSQLGMLAASPLPRLDVIRRSFKISADDGTGLLPDGASEGPANLQALRMTPASDEVARVVKQVRVLLDADRGLVLLFEIIDPDGERTTLEFSNLRGNTGLRDEDLVLPAPPGVRISRPLEQIETGRP